MLTAARLAIAQLKSLGVHLIFSLNGGHIAALYDACLDAGIRIIDVRHEDAAVHMAHAWSRLTNTTGVACVTAGPGLTNTVTAVAAAWSAATPLLLLGGKVPLKQFDLGALQDVDQIALMRPITKMTCVVLEGARIPEYLVQGVRLAWTPPHGPVYVELPTDVLRQEIQPGDVDAFIVHPAGDGGRPEPDATLLDRAVALLGSADRPVIVAGGGVVWSRASAELLAFAERLQAPVLTTSLARGVFPNDHPLNLFAARSFVMSHADLIVVVGTRFNYIQGYGRPPRFSDRVPIMQIDLASQELSRNRVADLAIQADAAAALAALTTNLPARSRPRAWLAEAREQQAKACAAVAAEAGSSAQPIHPLRLCSEVVRAVPRETTFVLDGGDILSFARQTVHPPSPERFLDPGPFGCLGVGLPFSNAAKLARPSAPVVCITGDGALGFHLMEFDTAVRHRLPIVIVVSNNAAWAIEANFQRVEFGRDRVIATLLRDVRLDLVAQALGGRGKRVTDPGDIGPAVLRALDAAEPAIIDVVTDPSYASPDLKRGLARVPDRQPLDFYGQRPT